LRGKPPQPSASEPALPFLTCSLAQNSTSSLLEVCFWPLGAMNMLNYFSDLLGSNSTSLRFDDSPPAPRKSVRMGGAKQALRKRLERWRGEISEPSVLKDEEEDVQIHPNPLNEVQILTGHTNIVRIMYKLDDFQWACPPLPLLQARSLLSRFCSMATAGDDCTIIVWNSAAGKQVVCLTYYFLPLSLEETNKQDSIPTNVRVMACWCQWPYLANNLPALA